MIVIIFVTISIGTVLCIKLIVPMLREHSSIPIHRNGRDQNSQYDTEEEEINKSPVEEIQKRKLNGDKKESMKREEHKTLMQEPVASEDPGYVNSKDENLRHTACDQRVLGSVSEAPEHKHVKDLISQQVTPEPCRAEATTNIASGNLLLLIIWHNIYRQTMYHHNFHNVMQCHY